jgi:hypothetical protein
MWSDELKSGKLAFTSIGKPGLMAPVSRFRE